MTQDDAKGELKMNIRHGDVEIIEVKEIPKEAILQEGRKTIAEGETTSHKHVIDIGDLFETKNGELYLDVKKLTEVSHEEHKTVAIPKGKYRVIIKRQYNAENGWERVID